MYPLFLDMRGKKCLVVGGGSIAYAKVMGLRAASAEVCVIAPRLSEKMEALFTEPSITLKKRTYEKGEAGDYFLIIAATSDEKVNRQVFDDATKQQRLINVVDVPALCGFFVPSIVRKGDLQVAISTNGHSPGISKRLRQELETYLPDTYAGLLKELGDFRKKLRTLVPSMQTRMQIHSENVANSAIEEYLDGNPKALQHLLKQRLSSATKEK